MAQKSIQSANHNYLVEAVPSFMQLPDGNFVRDGFLLNRRVDTLAVLGKTTERYGIIQNDTLINAAEDSFKAKGMTNYTRKIIVTGEGEKMYAVYDFKDHGKKLKVGDEIGLRLTVQNSFDGSLLGSFSLGLLRLLCLNGMTTLENEVAMTRKHSSSVNVGFIAEALEKAILAWNNATALFDRLADVRISQEQGLAILNNLEHTKAMSAKIRDAVTLIWNNPTHKEDAERNLFNLYNAVTQHLTHEVATERFELSNRVSANVLKALNNASIDPKKFTKLITLPTPVVTAMA